MTSDLKPFRCRCHELNGENLPSLSPLRVVLAVYRADDDEGPDEPWCDAGPKLILRFLNVSLVVKKINQVPGISSLKTLIIRTPENSGYQYVYLEYLVYSLFSAEIEKNLSPFCLVLMTMHCSTCLTNVGKNLTMQGFDTVVAACPQTTLFSVKPARWARGESSQKGVTCKRWYRSL